MRKLNQFILVLVPLLSILFLFEFTFGQDVPEEPTRKLLVKDLDFDKEQGIVSYELTHPAWIRVRLGLKEGPMCKTLVDWQKRPAGVHQESWDGLDPSGNINFLREDSLVYTFNYFTDGDEYISGANLNDIMMPPEHMVIGRSVPTLRLNQMHKEHPRPFCRDPEVNVTLPENIAKTETGKYIIEDQVAIEIDLAETDQQWFRRERYSIHLFVDGIFVGGELTGCTPYQWIFDPKYLNQGEHLLMVNLSGFDDHIGIAAIPIVITKKGK